MKIYWENKKKTTKSESLEPFTIDELNARIDKSLADSHNDNVIEVNDLIEEIEKWD